MPFKAGLDAIIMFKISPAIKNKYGAIGSPCLQSFCIGIGSLILLQEPILLKSCQGYIPENLTFKKLILDRDNGWDLLVFNFMV